MACASFLKLTSPTSTTNEDQTSADCPASPTGIQTNPSSHARRWKGIA